MDMLEVLKKLNRLHGPAGEETAVAAAIRELAAPYADEIKSDSMGNLIVHRSGNGPRVMFAAHMDSIGFLVTHIEKEGYLRVGKIGGISPSAVLNTPVRFKNGTRGVVTADAKTLAKGPKMDDVVVDIGAHSADEAKSMGIQVGDTAVYDTPTFSAGSRMVSPYMDNRICCIAQLMALEQVTSRENDLYFVFTTQEELGLRGAKTAAYSIEPDYAVVTDVTLSDDVVGADHSGSSHLGGGAAIKVMDNSVICHPAMVSLLEKLAQEHQIAAQRDIIRSGGTDAGPIHVSRTGVYTGGVSVPCRYIHTPTEMVERGDVEATARLLAAFAQSHLEQEL